MASKVEAFGWKSLSGNNGLIMSVIPVYGDLHSAVPAAVQVGMGLRVPDEPSSPWRVVVQEFDSPAWTRYEMTFSEWFLAYLKGRDVTLCSRNRAPDGPFWEFLS
ncbi:hypothetical protein ACIOWI_07125 [Streptomyces sp. NPDC087659]|uniref:hypothetical protein n=1 Tax=unclassified Streptomyces TaxID=2593676 RepID=UPI0036E1DA19